MKIKYRIIFIFTAVFTVITSCSLDTLPEKIETHYIVSPDGKNIHIECDGTVSWFSCSDKEGNSPKFLSTDTTLKLEDFVKPGIRYIKCKKNNNYDMYIVAYTGLPVVYIDTEIPIEEITKEEYVDGSLRIVLNDGTEDINQNISLKGRGNSSWTQSKKSYTIKFDDAYKILEMPKNKKWVLIANFSDKTLLRNYWASYIGNNIFTNMEWNPSFKLVDILFNGDYIGTYLIGESIKIDNKRIDIQDISKYSKNSFKDVNEDGQIDLYDGGFIIEVNERLDETFNFVTTNGVKISLKDPDEVDEIVQTHIKSIVQTAEIILYSDDYLNSENGYTKYFDVESFIDWYIVNEFTKNNDAAFFSSVFMFYNPESSKIEMGPDWDFDISCGNINYNNCDDPKGFWIKDSGWFERFFTDPYFVEQVKSRWNTVKFQLYYAVNNALMSQAYKLETSAELNFNKWDILGTYVWPNAEGYENRTTYLSEVEYMRNFLNDRYDWLDGAINNL